MFKTVVLTVSLLVSSMALAATSVLDSNFMNLSDDQSIRANNGNFAVAVFSPVGEHKLLLNGQDVDVEPAIEGAHTTAYYLKNVDRGTHTLSLVTESGTETIRVHVLRVHL